MFTSFSVPGSALFRLTEMGPEVSLVEFVSTSAAYRKTSKSSLSQLEHELLRVAPNNLMPANAASWYMAKRRFYQENPANNAQAPPGNNMKLLRFVLKSYPRKFALKGNQVEFLEKYDPNVARRKMSDLNKLGLLAYFEHKVEEYGVYFFDPYYYENTEPFHANFRQATSSFKAHRFGLYPSCTSEIYN